MAAKRPEASPEEIGRIAREIADTLAAVSTSLPDASRGSSAHPAPGGEGFDLEGPRAMLENGARFVAPVLPADARARRAKALLLRVLRIVTRDQTVFNSAILESLRIAFREIEQAVGDGRRRAEADASATAGRLAAVESGLGEGLQRIRSEALERTEALAREAEERIAKKLSSELAAESSAREVLGSELGSAQRRVDRLEREADRRGPEVDEVRASSARLESEVERLTRDLSKSRDDLQALRFEWTALRSELAPGRVSIPAVGDRAAVGSREDGLPDPGDPLRAGQYFGFEEAFRGSEEEIGRRQARDVDLFRGVRGPVADLGCGRGEFLSALAAAGIPGVGCDANPLMAARAREKGLAVDRADLFAWLADRPDGSLGGVVAYQVVEHLRTVDLFRLVEMAASKLSPGGRILLETVNPESVYAMKWFWMDLTHVRPVPGPSLAQLLRSTGFRDVTVEFRSPVPAEDRIPPAEAAGEGLAPVSRLLFGPQDVAVIGTK